jgi:hypothetical protein
MSLSFLLAASVAAAPVLHYLRTNSDGSEPEAVVVFAPAPGEVQVFKSKSRCTNAAYVTGELDPRTGQALRLVGGRLGRDLTQEPFAWLARDDDGVLRARLGSPDGAPAFEVPVGERWVQFDFDFSDLIAHPPAEILQREDFAVDMPLIMMADAGPSFVNRGELRLAFTGVSKRSDGEYLNYRATGPALGDLTGTLVFGARDGRLVEADFPLPNHAEYRNFRLRLQKRESGADAWRRALAAHWQDCPAPAPQ